MTMTRGDKLLTSLKKARALAMRSSVARTGRGLGPLAGKGEEVNPIWTKMIVDAVEKSSRTCPHCKKVALYARKQPGQFYKCKRCGHRFKEKG